MPRARSAIAFILPAQASESSRLDRVFFALADTTRRDILRRLKEEPLQVSTVAKAYAVSVQAVSRHIQVLVRAGLVRQERSGRISACRLDAGPLFETAVWINDYSHYWQTQFDTLKDWLEQDDRKRAAAEQGTSDKPAQKQRRKRHAI